MPITITEKPSNDSDTEAVAVAAEAKVAACASQTPRISPPVLCRTTHPPFRRIWTPPTSPSVSRPSRCGGRSTRPTHPHTLPSVRAQACYTAYHRLCLLPHLVDLDALLEAPKTEGTNHVSPLSR